MLFAIGIDIASHYEKRHVLGIVSDDKKHHGLEPQKREKQLVVGGMDSVTFYNFNHNST